MLVRSSDLAGTMSRYLIQRISSNQLIELLCDTELIGLTGEHHLEGVRWLNKKTGETSAVPLRHVFILAGASPNTDWLRGCVALDDKGFILTGHDLSLAKKREQALAGLWRGRPSCSRAACRDSLQWGTSEQGA